MGRLTRILLPGLLLLSVYYAVFGGRFSMFEVHTAGGELDAATAELERLRAENDSLRARADVLENDPLVLERLAREEFGMIRDGERFYRIDRGGALPAPNSEEPVADDSGETDGPG
ncbi:MAG TPA: septum formation initiator family protein [Longimicrobiales bacterium]|nr:septum formation initiator family protein [Longimicrobiales bacterium]